MPSGEARIRGLLAALAVGVIIAPIVLAHLSDDELRGDGLLDWLVLKGVASEMEYPTPIGVLADRFGQTLGPESEFFPSHDDWLHPRSPGALLLLSPFLLMTPEIVSRFAVVVGAICWLIAVGPVLRRVTGVPWHRYGLIAILATATTPVLMALEFGFHVPLLTVIIGVAWNRLDAGDDPLSGILLGLAGVLRVPLALCLVGAYLAGRKRSAIWGAATLAVTELSGMLIYQLSPGAVIEGATRATSQWVETAVNGASASFLLRLGIPESVASLLPLAAAATILVVWRIRSAEAPHVASAFAVCTVLAVAVSPVVWEQYLILLLPAIGWALAVSTPGRRYVIGSVLAFCNLALWAVRGLALDSPLRGSAIFVSLLVTGLAVAVVVAAEGVRTPTEPQLTI